MGDFRNYVTKLSWPFLCTKQLLFVYLILQFMVLLAEGGSFSYSLLLNYGLSHCWDFLMLHSCSFWCYWLSSYLCDKLRHIGQEGQSVRTFHSEGIANGKLGFRSIDLTGSSSRMGNSSDGDSEPHHATHWLTTGEVSNACSNSSGWYSCYRSIKSVCRFALALSSSVAWFLTMVVFS